jgi:hypothetical protein
VTLPIGAVCFPGVTRVRQMHVNPAGNQAAGRIART